MLNDLALNQLKAVLDQAHSVLILLGPTPTLDQTASALAFYDSLRDLKSEVSLGAPNEVSFDQLLGQEEIKQKLGNKDLSISFDYSEAAVDKVSYHIDEEKGKFYLVVKPQKGHKPLDPETVSFDLIGAQADVIFLFGVHSFAALEHLYDRYADLYHQATVVTVHNFETEIGDIKLDISGKSSWSESILSLIGKIGLELTADGATNLLVAIDEATEWLTSYTATADTFDSVARLLRAGGKRSPRPTPPVMPVMTPVVQMPFDAGEVVRPQPLDTKTSFEIALEEARQRQEAARAHSVKSTIVEKSPPKAKKKTKGAVPPLVDAMKNKNFVPDESSRRL